MTVFAGPRGALSALPWAAGWPARSNRRLRGRARAALVLGVAALACGVARGNGQGEDDAPAPVQPAAYLQSFSQLVRGHLPHTAYQFGTTASVPWAENGAAIRSLEDLSAHFNPLEDFTGATTINGELQVYAGAFNPTDHRLGEDGLGLWANLPGQSWTVRVGSQPNGRLGWSLGGGLIGWDRIPAPMLAHAAEWRVGQLLALQNRGIYYVSEIEHGVGFRLQALLDSPRTGEFQYNLIAFLPVDSALSVATFEGEPTRLQFAPGALAPTVQPGHRVALATEGTLVGNAADVVVTAVDHAAGTVTLNRNIPLGRPEVGRRYVFYPRITAGQAWTRRQWDITHPSAFLAVEFDIELFRGLSPNFEASGISGATAFAQADAVYPDAPFGAWPALWAYSADDGDPGKSKGTSEMDFMEVWVSSNSGMKLFSTGNVGGTSMWTRSGGGYWTTASGKNKLPYSVAGARKVGVVYTAHKTFHYLDDVLIRIEEFRWASQAPIQIGMNMAMGSIDRPLAANLNFPFRPENFTRAHMDVKGVKIWYRQQ